MRIFATLLGLCIINTAIAWPWDDSAEVLRDATYEAAMCMERAYDSYPIFANSRDSDKWTDAQWEMWKKIKNDDCGELRLEVEKVEIECLEDYDEDTCHQASRIGNVRARN